MSSLNISLHDWQNNSGFYESSGKPSRKTLTVGRIESNLCVYINVEFNSNSKEIIVSIRYLGHGEFARHDTKYVLEVFTIVKGIIEDTLGISIKDNLFMGYVLHKVQRGSSRTFCKMYINIKDLVKFV